MRLGGPLFDDVSDPEKWVAAQRRQGYSAAFCPVKDSAGAAAFVAAAREANIVIAEVGAWSNPLDADDAKRKTALAHCQAQLALAEETGARCCVNITGSRGADWAGHDARNLTGETFEMIVACTREIVDAVKPSRTFYALETMPWMFPHTTESYTRLLKAIDRPGVAVHFDPVNMVFSPEIYYNTAALIEDFVAQLGPQIKSVHAKDITLSAKLTVHLSETAPGQGNLDYRAFLRALDRLEPDLPVMLEHMTKPEEYAQAAAHIRSVASACGLKLR